MTQIAQLVGKLPGYELDVFGTGDAAEVRVYGLAQVFLPFPLAAPACQKQNAHLVAQVIECLRVTPEAFQAYGIEVHLAYQFQLLCIAFRSVAQKNVVRPSSPQQLYAFAIEGKGTIAVVGDEAAYLANAEPDSHLVGNNTFLTSLQSEGVKLGLA